MNKKYLYYLTKILTGILFLVVIFLPQWFDFFNPTVDFLLSMVLVVVVLVSGELIIKYGLKMDEGQISKKQLKITLGVFAAFFLLLVVPTLVLDRLDLENREDYAKQTELGQLFLEYYPEAQIEFNANKNKVTFINKNDKRKLYVQVGAEEKVRGEEILYCLDTPGGELMNEVVFEITDIEEMKERLESNECFK